MKQLSSVDLAYLIREFKILENERIDSFYFEDETFYVKFYVRGKGSKYLVNKISKYIFIDESKDESSEPSNFIQFLRKYLKNGFLREISQVGTERILKLRIEKKDGENLKDYILYIELFANGNVILCDSNNIIRNALLKKKYKDRELLVNKEYELPPPREFSLINLDFSKFYSTLDKDNLAKSLAIGLGIGGKYANELVLEEKLEESLNNLLNRELKPCLLIEGSEIKDFFPFKFKSISGEFREVDSFNLAVRDYFLTFKEEVDIKEKSYEKELLKLKNRLEKIEEQKKSILTQYEEFNSIGNKIYENYSGIDLFLKEINSLAKDKGWNIVEGEIDFLAKRLGIKVLKLEYKNNEIILEL